MHVCLGTTPALQRTMIFDRVAIDQVNRAKRVFEHASGKSINVARVLHALGEKAVACAPLGGERGEIVRRDLRRSRLPHRCIETAAQTRLCTTLLDEADRTATELVEEARPITAKERAAVFKALTALLPGAKTLVLSGSLTPGLAANFYADCCRAANRAGAAVIVDARGRKLMRALPARPMVAKCNRAELAATIGKPIDDEAELRKAMTLLHRRGAQWVIVTLGGDGARAHDGRNFWTIPAAKIRAVSAIGSGDAFAAGVAAGIARGQDVAESCRLGAACAAANALIPGSGLLRLADVRRLLKQTRVIRCR